MAVLTSHVFATRLYFILELENNTFFNKQDNDPFPKTYVGSVQNEHTQSGKIWAMGYAS